MPRKANAPRIIEIRALGPVGPVAAREHHLRDSGGGLGARWLERPFLMTAAGREGPEGPVQVGVEHAGQPGLLVQEDEGVGERDEPRLD